MSDSPSRRTSLLADLGMLLVAIVWGSAFVAQRRGMESIGPLTFNAARFALGGLVLIPADRWLRAAGRTAGRPGDLRGGVLLGTLLFGGAALQQIGLVETGAGKAGFITGLYVVLVPLLMALVWRERVGWNNWLGAVLAVGGLFLLSVQAAFRVAPGDGWVFGSALLWTLHVVAVGKIAPGRDPLFLAITQYLTCAALSLPFALALEGGTAAGLRAAAPAILYTGLLSTALGYTGQVVAQRYAPATHAAIILSGEAVFAALFGWWLLGERMTARQLVGSGLMLAGMLLAQFHPRPLSFPRRDRLLAAVAVVFLGLSAVYSFVTPIFEAPDEVWHYAYVRYLAEEHALPALDDDRSGAYQEVAQPPLYYAVAALMSGSVPDDDLPELMYHNPGFGYQAGPTVNDNKNMLIHTARERFPWRGAALAVHLARLASLLFAALTVVAAGGLGREAFPQRPGWALSVPLLVALVPQFLFIGGVVNNDSAAAALSTVALWLLARMVNRGATVKRGVLLGAVIGLAALTKTSALLLLGLVPVAAWDTRRPLRSRALTAAALVLTAGLVGGWWYLRNGLVYHDPLALHAHLDTPWGRESPAGLGELARELPQVYRSFWGGFGWGHVRYPDWVYGAVGVPLVLSLLGWIRAWRTGRFPIPRRIALLALLWGAAVGGALLLWMRTVEAPHGRLLFPALGAFALLTVAGWAALPRRAARRTRTVTLGGLAVLAALTPAVVIRPAFAPPRLLPPDEAAATVTGPSLLFGTGARLLGIAPTADSASPGGEWAVRACWEGVAPQDEDYTVFVHLIGRGNARVAERYTYPGLGRFPTSLWPVGAAFCDTYRLRVAEWAPAPELYDLLLGLFERETGRRLPVTDAAGRPVEYPVLTQVRVAPERPLALPDEAQPLDYRLGEDEIALIGYRVAGRSPLTVTLYWRARRPAAGDYVAFIHLVDGGDGSLLAQHDGRPRYGRYPTPAWRPGDVVPDEHPLTVPAWPAEARLYAGLYRADDLTRLPVVGPAGAVADGLIPLPLPMGRR